MSSDNISIAHFLTLLVTISLIMSILASEKYSARENASIESFRTYLRINTALPNPDFESAITWIKGQATSLNLEYNTVQFPNTTYGFVIWLTWTGVNPSVESVFLFSHIDVVAVDREWTHDPFGAEMDENNNIYGRGAQDMKSVGVQYLEAIRNMKAKGIQPNRTIHIGFFPDEETGGYEGIKLFVQTSEFKNLNIGFLLDEGMPSQKMNELTVYYAQRTLVWVKFTALGKSGHGSLLLNDTAGEKIQRIINTFLDMREYEKLQLDENQGETLTLGDVTTINLNILEGGIGANIIPPKLSVTFDMRFSLNWTTAEIQRLLNDTCLDAGPNVTYELLHHTFGSSEKLITLDDNNKSWWWTNFKLAFDSMNITVIPRVFPAGTDGQVTRQLGIPTLGFSPIYNTTMLFHDRDEYLNTDIFLKGIDIYETLIRNLVYIEPPPTPPPTPSTRTPTSTMTMGNEENIDKARTTVAFNNTKNSTKQKHSKSGGRKVWTANLGIQSSLVMLMGMLFNQIICKHLL